jgi:hypothetical protein
MKGDADCLRKLREDLHYWQQYEAIETRGLAATRAKLAAIQVEIDRLNPAPTERTPKQDGWTGRAQQLTLDKR